MFDFELEDIHETLAQELDDSVMELSDTLARVLDSDPSTAQPAIAEYSAATRRIAVAAEMLGISGVGDVAKFVDQNLDQLAQLPVEQRRADENYLDLFASWPLALSAHLRDREDMEIVGELLAQLQDPQWPRALADEQALVMLEKLLGPASGLEQDDHAVAEADADENTAARDADGLSLEFSEDINAQLVDAFLHEVPLRVADLSELIARFGAGGGADDDLLTAQRIAHTIKGSANIAGIGGIAGLTHAMEDILESCAERQCMPEHDLCELLTDACDCLAVALEYMLDLGAAPTNVTEIVTRLHGAHADLQVMEAAEPAPESVFDAASPSAVEQLSPVTAETAPAAGKTAASVAKSLRIATETVDHLLRYAGEVSISTVQLRGLHKLLNQQFAAVGEQFGLIKERMDDLQELVAVKGVPSARGELAVVGGDTHGFDPLEMDQYNELHSAANALLETVTDASEMNTGFAAAMSRLDNLLIDQDRVSKVLSDTVLASRMLPIESIVPRLERTVRQTARILDKEVELAVEGADILIDSEVLARITDPLIHMLRNAVDHGIEDADERGEAGKSPVGRIEMRFAREGDEVLIECRDDGAGFELDTIRRIAVDRGLLTPGQVIAEDELVRMTLLPGFSTRDDATQVSGRGIGMNLLYREVIEQRGAVDIDSRPGGGTTIQCRLPLTLVSIHVLLVEVHGRVLGIPSSSIEQMLYSDAGELRRNRSDQVFVMDGREYTLDNLARLLGMELPERGFEFAGLAPLLLVRADAAAVALAFDRAVDSGYLVVKNLGQYIPRLPGVIGGAILADGSLAPIIDLRDLIRLGGSALPFPVHLLDEPVLTDGLAEVLVVDDSLSARRTLSQLMQDAGFAVRTAIDGIDAINEIEQSQPAAILLDMEMPRMTGLELARHLRDQDDTHSIPIIMITSRSTEKHRQQASAAGVDLFVTKPYREDQLVSDLRRLISRTGGI